MNLVHNPIPFQLHTTNQPSTHTNTNKVLLAMASAATLQQGSAATAAAATSDSTAALLQQVAAWVQEADFVLIGAGAGMSVEAGVNYHDTKTFAAMHPGMVKRGFKYPYQLVGFDDWESPQLAWGYLAAHVTHVMGVPVPHKPTYGSLAQLVEGKDSFVITSNVDTLFHRHGFDTDRIYTPQGDWRYMQCKKPCRPDAYWRSEETIAKLMSGYSRATGEVDSKQELPTCPFCGSSDVFSSVRGGRWFLDSPYEAAAQRFDDWLLRVQKAVTTNSTAKAPKRVVVFDIGTGFNTPSVVRYRMERVAAALGDGARIVRINLDHAMFHMPAFQADSKSEHKRAIQLQMPAGEALSGIAAAAAKLAGAAGSKAGKGSDTASAAGSSSGVATAAGAGADTATTADAS